MFVISEIEDKFELEPQNISYNNKLLKKISIRYLRRHTKDLGIGVTLTKDFQILEQKLVQDFVLATVKFELLFFRFIRDEILFGVVIEQSHVGVSVAIAFFDKILVLPEFLPDENESTNIIDGDNKTSFAWVWKYKENRYVIKTGETVRMKVLCYDEQMGRLLCSFKDAGLGPVSWWQ